MSLGSDRGFRNFFEMNATKQNIFICYASLNDSWKNTLNLRV